MKIKFHRNDPIIRYPWLIGAVVFVALLMHPSGITVALAGFACAIVASEVIDYVLRG